MELIQGTDILVKFGEAGSEVITYCSTTCTLSLASETISTSCKTGSATSSWAQNVEGTKSWEVSVDGLYQNETPAGFVELSDLIITGPNTASIVIGMEDVPGTGEPSNYYWTGEAVLTSSSLTAPDGEVATWTATFVGNGELVKTEVAPV